MWIMRIDWWLPQPHGSWLSGQGIHTIYVYTHRKHTCQVTLHISESPIENQWGSQKYPGQLDRYEGELRTANVDSSTLQCHYIMQFSPKIFTKDTSIVNPLRWNKGCLCDLNLRSMFLPHSLHCCMQYHVVADHIKMTHGCFSKFWDIFHNMSHMH